MRTKLHITRIFTVLTLASVFCLFFSCSSARKAVAPSAGMSRELLAAGENVSELGKSQSLSIARAIAKTYTPWQKVSMKGKAKLEGLPVSLSVKIYMERTHSVIMSLSAPLLGEVGRVELTSDSVLLVNKKGKTYCKESIASYLSEFGASITDVQDLIMGRVFMLGYGTLTESNASMAEVSDGASDTWILTPKTQHPHAQYGFTLYHDGLMLMAAAFTPDEKYLATAEYAHDKDGSDINFNFKFSKKTITLDLSLDNPNYSPEPLTPVAISSKWEKLTFREWMKSFK